MGGGYKIKVPVQVIFKYHLLRGYFLFIEMCNLFKWTSNGNPSYWGRTLSNNI